MTGPEHYRKAEESMEFASRVARPDSGYSDEEATRLVGLALQRAQVHATLALAAATAMGSDLHAPDFLAWVAAASTEVTP